MLNDIQTWRLTELQPLIKRVDYPHRYDWSMNGSLVWEIFSPALRVLNKKDTYRNGWDHVFSLIEDVLHEIKGQEGNTEIIENKLCIMSVKFTDKISRFVQHTITQWEMICREDVETMSMSLKHRFQRLFRQDCGAEIDILATSTSFWHLFDKSLLTGKFKN